MIHPAMGPLKERGNLYVQSGSRSLLRGPATGSGTSRLTTCHQATGSPKNSGAGHSTGGDKGLKAHLAPKEIPTAMNGPWLPHSSSFRTALLAHSLLKPMTMSPAPFRVLLLDVLAIVLIARQLLAIAFCSTFWITD